MDESNRKHVKGDERGAMMRFKTIMENLSTIVHLLVEHITSLAKPKTYIEASIYIRKLT